MSGALAGSVILITGSTGIAAATATAALAEGASVFVICRTEAHAEDVRNTSAEIGISVADLAQGQQTIEAVHSCVERFGRIDGVFNVAGISGREFGDGPTHECSDLGWDATVDNNARSTFLVCRSVLQQMLAQKPRECGSRGAILNMASVLALSPEPRHFATHAYAASKGAIIAMSRSMAAYYAPHKIRVNTLAPGLVRTPMSARAQSNPAILGAIRDKQPLSEGMLSPDDVAHSAIFLLSDASMMITGVTLPVDGGWSVS